MRFEQGWGVGCICTLSWYLLSQASKERDDAQRSLGTANAHVVEVNSRFTALEASLQEVRLLRFAVKSHA